MMLALYHLFEIGIVTTLVGVSTWIVLGRIAPHWRRNLLASFASRLDGTRSPRWLRRIGRGIAPAKHDGSVSCGSACGGCGACNEGAVTRDAPMPSAEVDRIGGTQQSIIPIRAR